MGVNLLFLGEFVMSWVLIVVFVLGSFGDFYFTSRLLGRIGREGEANPLARWLYDRLGEWGLAGLKVVASLFFLGVVRLAWGSWYVDYVLLFGALLQVWVATRGQTLWSVVK